MSQVLIFFPQSPSLDFCGFPAFLFFFFPTQVLLFDFLEEESENVIYGKNYKDSLCNLWIVIKSALSAQSEGMLLCDNFS